MDRSPSSGLFSWLLAPVAAVLVLSALSLPQQPYTGLVLRADQVVDVVPGSPGERAGLAPGDRIRPRVAQSSPAIGPLTLAHPNRPLELERQRGQSFDRVWLWPEPLPPIERHMMAALLAVASGFVLLGGWVWSERRDRLTRTFFLLCLAFALLLAPPPRWPVPGLNLVHVTTLTGVALFLPALFVHFFAMFPGARTRGHLSAWVASCYWIASLLTAATLAVLVRPNLASSQAVHASASIWFSAAMLVALVLFVLSYWRAGNPDARRRLRVALVGTLFGAGPLAALIVIKNVAPGTAVPGERWAVLLTLLVPASFAWATVVHRIFDFRVALRAGVITLLVAVAGAAAYLFGDWLASVWWPDRGAHIAGGSLAFVALAFSFAGPAAPWLGSLGARVVPAEAEASLVAWMASQESDPDSPFSASRSMEDGIDRVLAESCDAIRRSLRLSDCLALAFEEGGARPIRSPGGQGVREPGPVLRSRLAKLYGWGVHSVDEVELPEADREALQIAGVDWLMPVGVDGARALLLLGKRLAGPWLGRREARELERFADHITVRLENETLRRAANSRGALDRELAQARIIQSDLLPRRVPVFPTLDCAAVAVSSEEVGGDYYDFVHGPGRDLTLAVGDAVGKGVPAALLLGQVQARFRSHAAGGPAPGELLTLLNRDLVDWDHPEKFVGLLCAGIEVRRGRVRVANAGLPPPLLRRRDGRFEEIGGGSLLLGVSGQASYSDTRIDLGAGDVMVLHTDGLTEARRGQEMFGTTRVQEVLERVNERRASDIMKALIDEVRAFTDQPLDDLTVVVLRQLTNPGRPDHKRSQNALKPSSATAEREG